MFSDGNNDKDTRWYNFNKGKSMKKLSSFLMATMLTLIFQTSILYAKEIKALNLGDYKFVVCNKYHGEELLRVIDKYFPDAIFSPDMSIKFKFKGKNYTMYTEKINYTGEPYYRIISISLE